MQPIRPRFPPPTIFATGHRAGLSRLLSIEDVLFRGCIKNQCVIVVTVLVKHGTVDEKYSKGGSFSVVFIRFTFFFFFFLPFSRDVLFRLTRVESWTMVTRLKERERVIINTWKIAVVILETGGDGLLV